MSLQEKCLQRAEQEAALQVLMVQNYREMAEAYGAQVQEVEVEGRCLYALLVLQQPLKYLKIKLTTGEP